MSFGPDPDPFAEFQQKFDLPDGFGGGLSLEHAFGDLVNDPTFVRDRVSTAIMYNFHGSYTF